MNRPSIQESEQMITAEGQIMSSCKERMILLFNWTILQRDGHCVDEFFDFERRRINNDHSQRWSAKEKREKKGTGQEQDGWD